jgi:hypothetical protein
MNMREQEELWEESDRYHDGKIRTFHAGPNDPGYVYKPACYENHKPLMIGGKPVYGGSCGHPMLTNADIYVGLDSSMKRSHHYPWNDPSDVLSIYFPLRDGAAPDDPVEFDKMIKWLAMQLAANKLIHIGCIGGHGRTGTVLAALVKEVDGIEDAITYVRENYCKKAVESSTQVAFLHKQYGIKVVPGSRNVVSVPKGTLKDSQGKPYKSKADQLWQQAQQEKLRNSRGPGEAHRAPPPSVPPIPLALRPSLPTGPIWAAPGASLMSVWGQGQQPVVDKRRKAANMGTSQEGAQSDGNHAED